MQDDIRDARRLIEQLRDLVRIEARDHSLWRLLASNLITAAFAVTHRLDGRDVLLVYCGQTTFNGVVAIMRMVHVRKIYVFAALFFLFHYGLFQLIFIFFALYVAFPHGIHPADQATLVWVLAGSLCFGISHIAGYLRTRNEIGATDVSTLMFLPYIRFVPIFFALVPNSGQGAALLLFLFLKTVADMVMHIVEIGVFTNRLNLRQVFARSAW